MNLLTGMLQNDPELGTNLTQIDYSTVEAVRELSKKNGGQGRD